MSAGKKTQRTLFSVQMFLIFLIFQCKGVALVPWICALNVSINAKRVLIKGQNLNYHAHTQKLCGFLWDLKSAFPVNSKPEIRSPQCELLLIWSL